MNRDSITAELLNDIEVDLNNFLKIIEKPCDTVWFCEVDNELYGLITCELNEEDINIPTISMSLIIGDITNASREMIIDLFSLNGDLHACSLSVEEIEDCLKLIIRRRIMVNSYQPGELKENIELMLNRLDIFLPKIKNILGL